MIPRHGDDAARATAEAVARRSYGKLIALLAARTGDVAGAEDALAEAFAAALRDWPVAGVPVNPEAWLSVAARRRMIDAARRRQHRERTDEHVRMLTEELASAEAGALEVVDHRLALMFACAHPAIDRGVRAPLILQTILGFDAAAIASAFLISPAAMGQRLVRAKSKIRQARIPFRVPEPAELGERLEAVLDAIYATFAEGWADASGTDARRRNLAEEGIWLGRLVVTLLPDAPEALGLLALMLHAEARRAARRDAAGAYVPLAEQDTGLWNVAMIQEAEALLRRASAGGPVGRYQLEAAVQSAHAVRRLSGRSDWPAIERIYTVLLSLTDSPVVAINRAVAAAEAYGPEAGLQALAATIDDTQMSEYQPYWAARASLLAAVGEVERAAKAYERAIGLEPDPAVRRFLHRRRERLRG